MKILDYLNKRVADPKTSAFPLISSVVFVPSNADNDILQIIEGVGGTNAVIRLPSSSSDILKNILDVLYRRKLVENTFRDLKVIDQTERYPYLSIFAQQGNQNSMLDVDGDCGEQHSKDNSIIGRNNANGTIENNTTYAIPNNLSYIVLKNNEDWTTCSSMLPRELKKLRKKERRKHPVTFSDIDNTQTERLFNESTEREKIDKSILKRLTSAAATSVPRQKSENFDNGSVPYIMSVQSRDSRTVQSSPSDSGTDNSDDGNDDDNNGNNDSNDGDDDNVDTTKLDASTYVLQE